MRYDSSANEALATNDLFSTNWVLDVKITLQPTDWDTIRFPSWDFSGALSESSQYAPPNHPYTYVQASVFIDGVEFPRVGIRKKVHWFAKSHSPIS